MNFYKAVVETLRDKMSKLKKGLTVKGKIGQTVLYRPTT